MTVPQKPCKTLDNEVQGLGSRERTWLLHMPACHFTGAEKSKCQSLIQTQPSSHFAIWDELRFGCASEPSRDLVKTALPQAFLIQQAQVRPKILHWW